ncbi:unnamed protein product [Rotaria sp. Silwood2]|nr:unnamed protein product [Rotaria sp. Silwood2]
MLLDIQTSITLTDKYREDCKYCCPKILFSVMVLNSNSWTFSSISNVILPTELQETLNSFENFYCHRHSRRRLTWLHQYSIGALQVSMYQMIVLLLFNEKLSWIIKEIQEKTQICDDLLIQVLSSLLASKILFVEGINEDFHESDITINHKVVLAENFTKEKIQVNLNVPIKLCSEQDLESLNDSINQDRKLAIQAAIVRIMKEKKNQKYSLLVQETIEKLSSFFKPNISSIKKCIDFLIDDEYLGRDPVDKTLLHYI